MAVDAPVVPGPKFEFISKAIGPAPSGDDGRRRFRLTASSTIEDRAGDEITREALERAAQGFRDGITIFIDHDFKKVDKAFGLSDSATVVQRGMDPKTNKPIWDLDIEGVVNAPNQRAVNLADSIDGGYAKFGASITAIVRKHSRKSNGAMLITDIEPLEASVVGIAENQRSWAHKAALAIKSYGGVTGSSDPEDEDDDMPTTDTINKELGAAATLTGTTLLPGSPTFTTTSSTSVTPTMITIDPPVVVEKQIAEPEAPADVAPDESVSNAEDVQASTAGDPAPEETPETASDGADSAETDPVTEKALDGVPEAQVAELLSKVGVLVQKMSDLQVENETLKAQNASLVEKSKVAEQVEDVSTAIRKALDMPLRPKAQAAIEGAVRGAPIFEGFPEVQEYLNKRSKIQ